MTVTQTIIDRAKEADDAVMDLVHASNNVLVLITNFSGDPTIGWKLQSEYGPKLMAAVARVRRSRK